MSKIANYFDLTLYSRNRIIKDKVFFSFILMASNKESLDIAINYFNKYLNYRTTTNGVNFMQENTYRYFSRTFAV